MTDVSSVRPRRIVRLVDDLSRFHEDDDSQLSLDRVLNSHESRVRVRVDSSRTFHGQHTRRI